MVRQIQPTCHSWSTRFAYVEPPHRYVRDTSTSVVHHEDYLDSRDDLALCGTAFQEPTRMSQTARPTAVCPDCEAKLMEYHLMWWRDRARAAMAENDELRTKYRELAENADDRHGQPAAAQPPAQGRDSSSREQPGGHVKDPEEPQGDSTAQRPGSKPESLLDHARRELVELCQQFDEAVPYRRVKNTMQSFSDRLNSNERVLLAQQIGNDGSLLRWSTTELQNQGWHITDNPLQGEPEAMWDAWTRDSQQRPKQSRWRLGRPRSHDGS
jgi:hypothetical protein